MTTLGVIIVVAVLAVLVVAFFVLMQPVLWMRGLVSGCYVSMISLLRMRFNRLDARTIVNCYIKARKSGIVVSLAQIERHAQAHGNVNSVIDALIAAHNAGIELAAQTAMAIDLAGRDIKEAVKNYITPKVILTDQINAVAGDGIELSVKAKVTVRTNLKRIIGSGPEETVIARVCECIAASVGRNANHKDLLENPDRISKNVLANRSICSDTAFDILSVDIAEIEVGRNIGAELAIDSAEATKYIAQADAEKRRSEALAAEQEMKVLTQEMRVRVLAAESELPRAIADAFVRGKISTAEYYKLQNLLSGGEVRGTADAVKPRVSVPVKKKSKLG